MKLTPAELRRLRREHEDAAMRCAAILDSGKRDPTWHESQALENASLALGRALLAAGRTPSEAP